MKPDNKKAKILMEGVTTITPEMIKKANREMARRYTGRSEYSLKGVKNAVCPACENASMDYAENLVFDITLAGMGMVISNLSGIRCRKCAEISFDAKSIKIIDKYMMV